MKHLIVGLTVAALGFTAVVGSARGPKPDGTIALSGGSVAAGTEDAAAASLIALRRAPAGRDDGRRKI